MLHHHTSLEKILIVVVFRIIGKAMYVPENYNLAKWLK